MDADFTFASTVFPPVNDVASNPSVQDVASMISSMCDSSSSVFVQLCQSLPNIDLQPLEVQHAKAVLEAFPAFAAARMRAVPRWVNDERFWNAFFSCLAHDVRSRARDAEDDSENCRVVLRPPTTSSTSGDNKKSKSPSLKEKMQSLVTSLNSSSSSAGATTAQRMFVPSKFVIASTGTSSTNNNNTKSANNDTLLMARDSTRALTKKAWKASLNEMIDFSV